MRALLLVAALLAGGGVLLATLWGARASARGAGESEDVPSSSAAATGAARPDDARVDALERRLDELALDLGALQDELRRLGAARRAPLAEPAAAVAPRSERAEAEERGPAWYLEQYVASFAGDGEGSEYFRLAVEAFAPSLVREIGALVGDRRAHATLRLRLVEMLGGPRFRGHGAALDALLGVVAGRAGEPIVGAALAALQNVGDARTAQALERMVWSIEPASSRWQAVQAIVVLSGDAANAALVRLWTRADDADRPQLVGLAVPNEGVDSLELFELASLAGQPVRLQAAQAIGQFRFPGFPPFVASWIARERDEAVRDALGASSARLSAAPSWSAERACGPPDADPSRDDANAWASSRGDMGEQWLELGYDPPLPAHALRVFEVCVAGALTSAVAFDERGGRHELWSGVDPTTTPGVFEIAFEPTAYRVRAVRLTLDTDRSPGWSEIDAVELVGPAGRAWASTARASSSYGDR